MERQEETIRTIADLIQSVNTQIGDSSNRITTLEGLTKKLIPNETEQVDFSEKQSTRKELTLEEEEAYIIRVLEQQRIERVMDLQNQECINEKLMILIDLNDDIMQSVREYLEKKEETRRDETKLAESRIKHYTENLVEPTIGVLDSNLFDLYNGIQDTEKLFNGFIESLQDSNEKISPEYQGKLNDLIKVINQVFNK